MNPYLDFVLGFKEAQSRFAALASEPASPLELPVPRKDARPVLLFSPHPDDECIIGALPLRLRRDLQLPVINIVVTQGRIPQRLDPRLLEVQAACRFLGFDSQQTAPQGLSNITLADKEKDPEHWKRCVTVFASALQQHQPGTIFCPHATDFNTAHIGTHHLLLEALQLMPDHFQCQVIETEFWAPMTQPNLMVESSPSDVANLIAALTNHRGEIARNPYHLSLPSWMNDNVRRGAEIIGGQGTAAPSFTFATLYRLRRWHHGTLHDHQPTPHFLSAQDNLELIFTVAPLKL